MSHETAQNKSCNEVVFRRSSLTSRSRLTLRDQLLQSSITRVVSGADGSATIGAPAAPVAKRPRLKAMASSKGSVAARVAVSSFVDWKLESRLREAEVVQTLKVGAAAATPVRISETVRPARLHRIISRTVPAASTKSASVAAGSER